MTNTVFDLDEINNLFQKVVKHSQTLEYSELESVEFNTKEIIKKWYEAKKDFIEFWGGPILEDDIVSFGLEEQVKANKVWDFADRVQTYYFNNKLSDFIFTNKKNFFDNLTVEDYTVFDYEQEKEIKIRKGSKIIKSFKYFESDPNILRQIQDEASMLIQQDKLTGKLCFSVHPLDFLSLSENNYNWRSCHALDGDYRAGNLSYMLDNSTIICYIKGEEDQKLPRFPSEIKWNSKKWRLLLFVDDERKTLFAGRQYPFNTVEGLKYISKTLQTEKVIPNKDASPWWSDCWHNWHNDYVGDKYISYKGEENNPFYLPKYAVIRQKLYCLNDIVKDQSKLHYNDLLFSHTYKYPYYCYFDNLSGKSPKFKIGATVPCPICNNIDLDVSWALECYECRSKYNLPEEE